jgi:Flp pilus assembly protein TadG
LCNRRLFARARRYVCDHLINAFERARLGGMVRDTSGASAVEFVIILPILTLSLFAIIKFSIVMNNYIELNSGTRSGVRVLALSRGSATPYTDSVAAFRGSASNIPVSVTPTMSVNGSACNSNGTCQSLLTTANIGTPVVVSATYACDLKITGINFAPGCQLVSQTTERAE